MTIFRSIFVCAILVSSIHGIAQNYYQSYQSFKNRVSDDYQSFRDECNRKYVDFLKSAWAWYDGQAPLPLPKDDKPVPPRPYEGDGGEGATPISTVPVEVTPIEETPQPKPVEPIREAPVAEDDYFAVGFYGAPCKVRLPETAKLTLRDCSGESIAAGWERLCCDGMNNAIRDCLETRIRYNLCDWAYLLFLDELGRKYCSDKNGATLLTAFLYCQSGYQMRLGVDNNRLVLLYGSRHQIFDRPYFNIDATCFYPFGETSESISICNAEFEGETPMSLLVKSEQMLGDGLSKEREIRSKRYADLTATSQVPQNLIEFFNRYPTSALDGNPMTRWAMYANTPLAKATKDRIYPSLKKAIAGCTDETAANKLLNWVQTGFVYEYDDKVWGHDRAFFAEESLYYPYCDCEDRSILFSRLVRDLLGLDVALIYYPGHLATAVCFNNEVRGDAMMIAGRRFVVCDPTYIGAPVGAQMPDLAYDQAQAIILSK